MFAAPILIFFGSTKGSSKTVGKIKFFTKEKYVLIETESILFQKPTKYVLPEHEVRTTCEMKPGSGTELKETWLVYPKFNEPKFSLYLPHTLRRYYISQRYGYSVSEA